LTSRINRIESILENESGNFTILSIQEEDRKRIARDLHDTSLQNLTHLIHQIELSGLYIDQDPIQAKLELSLVNKKIREIIDEIRNTIFNLRPMTFDDLGLKAVFERLADSINEDKQYEIELDVEDVSCETNIILVTIYRVVHECLNNIVKHAEATKISLSCRCIENNCHIVISDNGKGFSDMTDDGTKHFGIFCMKERIKLLGGKIYIDSSPEWGTTISINVPLNVHIN
jgi:Signal transduction histidine kinase